jgi:hypothetical protein
LKTHSKGFRMTKDELDSGMYGVGSDPKNDVPFSDIIKFIIIVFGSIAILDIAIEIIVRWK